MGCVHGRIRNYSIDYELEGGIKKYLKAARAHKFSNWHMCEYISRHRNDPGMTAFRDAVEKGGYKYFKVSYFLYE